MAQDQIVNSDLKKNPDICKAMEKLSLDQFLFLCFNKNHTPFFDWLMSLASNALTWIPIYLFGLFLLLRLLKMINPSYFLVNTGLILVSLLAIILICYEWLPVIFPHFISRIKPCYDEELSYAIHTVGDACGDKYGFYAFRACTVFALSTFLCLAFQETARWMKIILIGWALFVSYSRIYLGAHYPANVLVSALAGLVIGYCSFRIYHYIKDSVFVV